MLNKKLGLKIFTVGYVMSFSFTTVFANNLSTSQNLDMVNLSNIDSVNGSNYDLNMDEVNEDIMILTYDEALQRAIKANSSIKSLQESLDVLDDQRRRGLNRYNEVRSYGIEDDSVKAMRSVVSLQYQMLNSAVQEKLLKDSVELMLINYLINVTKYELDIQLLEESIELAEIDYKNMQLKNSLGLVSENDLDNYMKNLEGYYSTLELTNLALRSEREALNNLLNININENIMVLYTPDTETKTVSLNSYILGKIQQDPNVESKRQALKQAEYNRDTRISSESRLQLQNSVDNAHRDLEDAKSKVETSIRSAYNNLQRLAQNRSTLELNLEKAYSDYNTALRMYEAGTGTLLQVSYADIDISSAKVELEKNNFDYAIQLFLFNNPHLM